MTTKPLPDARCKTCGLPMFYVGFPDHGSCADTPEGALIRARNAAYEAGLAGQAIAIDAHTDHAAAALEMIRRTALVRQEFNADDVRELFPAWDLLHNKTRSACFGTAASKTNRYIVASGVMDRSTYGPTHGHRILRWRSLIYVDQFKTGVVSGRKAS